MDGGDQLRIELLGTVRPCNVTQIRDSCRGDGSRYSIERVVRRANRPTKCELCRTDLKPFGPGGETSSESPRFPGRITMPIR